RGRWWKDLTVRLGGAEVGTLATGKELQAGATFPLPDGSQLQVRQIQSFLGVELQVLKESNLSFAMWTALNPDRLLTAGARLLITLAALFATGQPAIAQTTAAPNPTTAPAVPSPAAPSPPPGSLPAPNAAGQNPPLVNVPPPTPMPSFLPFPQFPPLLLDEANNRVGIAQETARAQKLQARVLWIDATANLNRINSAEKIAALVDKIKKTGFNTVVLDVKPIVGYTLYPSKLAPKLTE